MSDKPIIYEKCCTPLVARSPDDLVNTFEKFSVLIDRVFGRTDSGSAIYQLDECQEIDAGGILLLMHAGLILNRLDWTAMVSGSGEAMKLVLKHLNHLLQDEVTKHDESTEDGNYLLRAIASRDEMVDQIAEWAQTVRRITEAPARDVAIWEFQISEIATNSFQHGLREKPAVPDMLVAGKAAPDRKSVQLAALDYGLSIPGTIEEVFPDLGDDDGQKIKFAARKGVTSKSVAENQGAGLHSLVDAVKQNKGNMLILSRNGLFHVTNGRSYHRKLVPSRRNGPILDGTLTVINLMIS